MGKQWDGFEPISEKLVLVEVRRQTQFAFARVHGDKDMREAGVDSLVACDLAGANLREIQFAAVKPASHLDGILAKNGALVVARTEK